MLDVVGMSEREKQDKPIDIDGLFKKLDDAAGAAARPKLNPVITRKPEIEQEAVEYPLQETFSCLVYTTFIKGVTRQIGLVQWLIVQSLLPWYRGNREYIKTQKIEWSPGEQVIDNEKFLRALDEDISHGETGPRARSGALSKDMKRLYRLFSDGKVQPPRGEVGEI